MKQSNYDKTRDAMRERFLEYDQDAMIQKFSLRADASYLYLPMLARQYRVCRASGVVWRPEADGTWCEADYLESLTIYDVLSRTKPDCGLSGRFAAAGSLQGVVYTGHTCLSAPGCAFDAVAAEFDSQPQRLEEACRLLGGTPEGCGDVAYRIPLFDFLPVLFRFWRADEEFPASITLLWDEHVLDYMYYESVCYAELLLMRRLEELTGVR